LLSAEPYPLWMSECEFILAPEFAAHFVCTHLQLPRRSQRRRRRRHRGASQWLHPGTWPCCAKDRRERSQPKHPALRRAESLPGQRRRRLPLTFPVAKLRMPQFFRPAAVSGRLYPKSHRQSCSTCTSFCFDDGDRGWVRNVHSVDSRFGPKLTPRPARYFYLAPSWDSTCKVQKGFWCLVCWAWAAPQNDFLLTGQKEEGKSGLLPCQGLRKLLL